MIYHHERGEAAWKTYKGPVPDMPSGRVEPWLVKIFYGYMTARGLDPKLAQENGWYPADMDVPRLVIPCTNTMGTPYWQARAMDSTTALRYDSPRAPRGDSVVVVWSHNSDLTSRAVIVEGPLDALAAAAFGYLGVAVMGNNPAQEALDNIVRMFGRTHTPFLILPDMDHEEFGATLVAAFASRGVAANMATLRGGKDLCELSLWARGLFFELLERKKKK
jgi:hypothetical protein